MERYCSAFFDFADMRVASEREMAAAGLRFVSVSDVYPFAPAQYEQPGFPYTRPNDCKLRWVAGTSSSSGSEVWVTASCVYVPYFFETSVEPFTHMTISTGLAAGESVESCIENKQCSFLS